jgi:MFS family permease
VPLQVIALGASPLQLGIAVAINTAASLAFLLIGGAIADRMARRSLVLASDLASGITVALIALLSASAQLHIEHVYVASAVLGASGAFLGPAYSALIADLVPAHVLRSGNAARLLGRSLARIVGPTSGGIAVAVAGPALAFAIDAGTFVFSFAVLLQARSPAPDRPPAASLLRDIRAGLGFVRSTPCLWKTLLYCMLVNVANAG